MKSIKKIFILTICIAMSVALIASCSSMPAADNGTAIAAEKGAITSDEAKNIALNHAGLKAEDVTFVAVHTDTEDGTEIYDVEFICEDKEYDYDIEVATGKILNYDFEIDYAIPGSDKTLEEAEKNYIGIDKAKEIVINKTGFDAKNVVYKKAKLENENGKAVYSIECILNNNEPVGVECEIDALTGDILSWEQSSDDDDHGFEAEEAVGLIDEDSKEPVSEDATKANLKGYYDIEKAKEAAAKKAGFKASEVKFEDIELYKFADGSAIYLIEFEVKDVDYEVEMDAITGNINGIAKEDLKIAIDEDSGAEVEIATDIEEDERDVDDRNDIDDDDRNDD